MSLEVRLGQRQEQRLALLPQMLQSIEVLQMATTDLLQFLELEAAQNETIELTDVARAADEFGDVAAAATADVTGDDAGDRDRGEFAGDDDWTPRARGDAGESDGKRAFLENVADREGTLVDFVREQVAFREVPDELAAAVVQLTEHLDERGLLPFPLPDLAAEFGLPLELLEEARDELQSLEPRGIGAADPVAAMLLQAAGDPDLAVIEQLLKRHLEALGKNRLPDVAREVDLSIDELQEVIARIRQLNPRPASEFSDEIAQAIRPDAYVAFIDGRVLVSLDDAALPGVGIDAEYAALAAEATTAREVKDYLRPKLRSARELISAVEQRRETLLRVVHAVMEQQIQFLQRGRAAIVPLRMSDVADRLEMHTSTVSRAIAGKHVATSFGLFRLRDFFDGGRLNGGAGNPRAGQGRLGVAQQIADLVAAEDKSAPLSDDDLVQALASKGVSVARRTIAKYRKELEIPSSYRRRRYGGEA